MYRSLAKNWQFKLENVFLLISFSSMSFYRYSRYFQNAVGLSCSQQTTTLNMDLEFATEIPEAHNFQEISRGNNTISCYTDDSKKNDQVGTVVQITEGMNLVNEESYHLGPNSSVFQAETFAVRGTI